MQFDLECLTRAPFNLNAEAIGWVRQTMESLSLEDSIAQLFNIGVRGPVDGWAEEIRRLKPGGVTRMYLGDGAAELDLMERLTLDAEVPLLVSADVEGSRMSFQFGTTFPSPLAVAAADDLTLSREIAAAMAAEAATVGVNWSFTPVLDVNKAWRSAIVATRSYGSNAERVLENALIQLEELQKAGVAGCLKHWPGEGYDDRDQHTVTTINPLSMDEWEKTFGEMYRAGIAAGALSIMSAHIALPAFVRSIDPDAGIEAFRPASASRLLNEELLRKRFGFNGLIVSDASEMAGLTSFVELKQAKVDLLVNGCDMVLFTRDLPRDIANVKSALESGYLSKLRLEEALARVLGLKAALGLHLSKRNAPVSARAAALNGHDVRELTRRAHARAPTLVKDVQSLFPISPQSHRRIYLASPGIVTPLERNVPFLLPQLLREHGFEVTEHVVGGPILCEDHDLLLFAFAEETMICRNRIWLDWTGLTGSFRDSMKRSWFDMPTAMVSFGFPYYLYDAPRMPAYINAYNSTDDMQRAVFDCLVGRAPFVGVSPVDAFCGLEDARY